MAPELGGQHSEEILLEFGCAWEAIAALREGGALGYPPQSRHVALIRTSSWWMALVNAESNNARL
jgi:hypothetical protein